MGEPIENEYFNWLCAKVLEPNTRVYHMLLSILHQTEFVWVVHADINRAEEGIELRQDFLREVRTEPNRGWEQQPCSVLEMLIALAMRASFQTDTPPRKWFWIFMVNLQLDQFRHVSGSDITMIERILDTFTWRTYDPRGYGGLFPMNHTDRDQRRLELWYQFCEYLEDQGLL